MPRVGLSGLCQALDDGVVKNPTESLWRVSLSSFHYDTSPPSEVFNTFKCPKIEPPSAFSTIHSDVSKSNKLAFSLNSLTHPNGSLYFGIGHCLYEVPLHKWDSCGSNGNGNEEVHCSDPCFPERRPRCVCVLQPCEILPSTRFLCMFRICSSPDGSLFVLLSHALTTGLAPEDSGRSCECRGEDVEDNRLFHVRLDGSFTEVPLPSKDVNYIVVWQRDCLVVSSTMAWDKHEQSPPVWILKNVTPSLIASDGDKWVPRRVSINLSPDPPIYLLVQDTLPGGEILIMVERELQTDAGRSHTEIYKCRVELDPSISFEEHEVETHGCSTPLSLPDCSSPQNSSTPSGRSATLRSETRIASTTKPIPVKSDNGARLFATKLFSHEYLEKVIKSSLPINHIIASHSGCIYCYDLSSAYVDSVWQLGYCEGMTNLACIREMAKFHSSDYCYRGRCSASTPAGEYMLSVELRVNGEGEREIVVSRQALRQLRFNEPVGKPCPDMYQKPWTDIRLKTNDGAIVEAHRVVLATRCEYFWKLLTTPMRGGLRGDLKEISVPYSKAAVESLVRYLYCEDFDELEKECCFRSLLELTVMADYFCIPSVAEKAFTLLMDGLKPSTALDAYLAASNFCPDATRVSIVLLHASHLIAHNLPDIIKDRPEEMQQLIADPGLSSRLRQVLCERNEHRPELILKLQELAKTSCDFHVSLMQFLIDLRLKDCAYERKGCVVRYNTSGFE